jgi:hypothetical protein
MSDQFTDQLSAYLDGELDPVRRSRLTEHLAGCAECTEVLADLRAIVAAAPEYPGRAPARDLWPEIEARLGGTEGRKDGTTEGVVPLRQPSVLPSFRRFSLGQLLAASIAMAAIGGGSVWLALRAGGASSAPSRTIVSVPPSPLPPDRPTGDSAARPVDVAPVRSPGVPPVRLTGRSPDRTLSFADASYDRAVRDLERVLETGRSRLDSTTVATIEQSLRKIDTAIAEARAAIQRDPANAYLSRQVVTNMRLKLELLRVAANAINART